MSNHNSHSDTGRDQWSAAGDDPAPTDRDIAITAAGNPPKPTEREEEIQATGISTCDAAGRIDGIHVLGVLHRHPLAIARVVGAITRYEPDVVAVEASPEAVGQYHPDVQDPRWPPAHEIEAAAFVAAHDDDLVIVALDTFDWNQSADLGQLDREIFTELGIVPSEDAVTQETYYELDREEIREWRRHTEQRNPSAYKQVIARRDVVMAGHLRALIENETVETLIAVVGMQHVTGVIDWLAAPSQIPDTLVTTPPWSDYLTI
ncbi:MAG: hypothetical protein ACQETI_01205 [Halobacteriota archaeon]